MRGRFEGDASTSAALMVVSASSMSVTWWNPDSTCVEVCEHAQQ